MTIDVTIKKLIKEAKEIRDQTKNNIMLYWKSKEELEEIAKYDEQLAEWLRELKKFREVYGICPSYEMCIPECKEGYNAQIAEAKRLLKLAVEDMNNGGCNSNCYKCKHCGECDFSERFTWKHTDEALKLIES